MKYYLIASLFLFTSVFGETIPLNLSETTTRAIRESEDYQIQKNEVIKSEYKTKETASILYPQITGELTYLNNLKYPEIPSSRMIKNFIFDAGINVNQIITTFGKISSSIAAMKKFTTMNRFREESVKDEVVFNSKLLYFNAYFANRVLQITKESYENVLKNKELLEKNSETGRLSTRDSIKLSADVAARIPLIANAESSYKIAIESLKKALGIDPDSDIELIEGYRTNYGNFNIKQAIAHLELHQPVLKALKQSIGAQEDLIKSKKAEYFPNLSAFFRYNYKGASDEYFIGNDTLFNYTAVGFNLQIPLFYGTRTRDKVRQSVADKDNAILTFEKTKKNLELELEKAIIEYNELITTLPANEEAENLAQESFRLSQNLFASGQLSATDLNDAEMMLMNQKFKKETSLFKLQVALAKIERLTCIGATYE